MRLDLCNLITIPIDSRSLTHQYHTTRRQWPQQRWPGPPRPSRSYNRPVHLSTMVPLYPHCPINCSDIINYAAGYIDDSDEEENNPTDYVHSLLLSAGAQPTLLNPLIDRLNALISDRIAHNPMKKSLEPVRLESTVQIAAQKGVASTLNLVGAKVDLDSVAGRKVETRVDVKKLEKVLQQHSIC